MNKLLNQLLHMQFGELDELGLGVFVFGGLLGMTAVEYIFGIAHAPGFLMWIIALTKGGMVLWFFMHLPRVFNPNDGEHKK